MIVWCGSSQLSWVPPKDCSSCPKDDCEDEGACRWIGGRCVAIPVNGGWSEWGAWGACNTRTGRKKRTRECNNPHPSHSGAPCTGSYTQETTCGPGDILTKA